MASQKTIKKVTSRRNSWLSRLLRLHKEITENSSSDQPASVLLLDDLLQKGQVVELNNNTYDRIVGDESRDVMVEYFDAKVSQ